MKLALGPGCFYKTHACSKILYAKQNDFTSLINFSHTNLYFSHTEFYFAFVVSAV